MVKIPIQTFEELGDAAQRLFTALDDGTDLAAALIGSAYLDQSLRSMIASKLVDDDFSRHLVNGRLSTASLRIDLAYSLGLISGAVRHDLSLINDIRNDFAHGHLDVGFDDNEVATKCNDLTWIRTILPLLAALASSPRELFELEVTWLAQQLVHDLMSIKHIAPYGTNARFPRT